jgi:predicted site-specific integrase-resolvase
MQTTARLLTRRQLAKKLQVSLSTLDKMRYAGRITAVNVSTRTNGCVRFEYEMVKEQLKKAK